MKVKTFYLAPTAAASHALAWIQRMAGGSVKRKIKRLLQKKKQAMNCSGAFKKLPELSTALTAIKL